jgi:DNA primase
VSLFEKWGVWSQDTIEAFGICYDQERFRIMGDITHTGPALIIPHYFEGKLVGFQERWLGELPPKFPKYTNSRDFPKELTLFNWDHVKGARQVIVVESVMTTVRLYELGMASVCTFGGSINPRQIQLLGTFDLVAIARDNDSTGARYQSRLGRALEPLTRVEVFPPPPLEKGDLADLSDEEIFDLVALSRPFATT